MKVRPNTRFTFYTNLAVLQRYQLFYYTQSKPGAAKFAGGIGSGLLKTIEYYLLFFKWYAYSGIFNIKLNNHLFIIFFYTLGGYSYPSFFGKLYSIRDKV